jgi:hypothetical protein
VNEDWRPLTTEDASMGAKAPTIDTIPVHCAPKKGHSSVNTTAISRDFTGFLAGNALPAGRWQDLR